MVRAIVYKSTGPANVLEYVKNWQVPPRKPGENDKEVRNQTLIPRQVRVAVKSSSYNPVDSKTRNGGPGREVKLPKVPGGDLAGLVVESDSDSRFQANEAVMAFTTGAFGSEPNGTWTEYANVPEEWLARVPPNLSLDSEAGAVPLVALTAFQALDSCNLTPGARVLIHAGSGGVGHIAVQLAKQHWEAYVISTARNVEFVKSLGADEVIDYDKEDFARRLADKKVDAVIDLIGGDTEVKSYDILKEDGTFAHIRNTGTDMARVEAGKKWQGKKYTYTIVKPDGKQLGMIAQLIADGKLKPNIADVVPLEKARDLEEIASKKNSGKIVIRI